MLLTVKTDTANKFQSLEVKNWKMMTNYIVFCICIIIVRDAEANCLDSQRQKKDTGILLWRKTLASDQNDETDAEKFEYL